MKEFCLIGQTYEEGFKELVSAIDTSSEMAYIIDYRADFANSKIIRDFVGAIFDAFTVPKPWRGRFILITDELINNSIEHGSQENDMNRCIINVEKNGNNTLFRISVEVHDTGNKGEKFVSLEEIKKEQDEKKIEKNNIYMGKRGRGLFHITEKIVDKLTFGESEKGGLMVKIEKNIDTSKTQDSDK